MRLEYSSTLRSPFLYQFCSKLLSVFGRWRVRFQLFQFSLQQHLFSSLVSLGNRNEICNFMLQAGVCSG